MALAQVLAHQGGWDEILLVGGPVLVFAGLLLLARKRAHDLTGPDLTGAHDADARRGSDKAGGATRG